MQPTKPGYTTTEWWLTVLTNVAAAAALLSPQLGVKLADPAVIQAVALVAAAVANIVYTISRSHVKAAAAHPLAYAPVPKGAGAAAAPVGTMPFHTGVADGEAPEVVKDWQAAAKLQSHHPAAATAKRRPRQQRG